MKNKLKAIFYASGILLSVILILVIANIKANITASVEVNNNLQNPSSHQEQNMSDALYQQKSALSEIMDDGGFSSYDIIYFKKLDNGNYEFEIQGIVDYGTAVVYDERRRLNINTSKLKDNGNNVNVDSILNMTKGPLGGLLAKETNLPDGLSDYNIVYYKDSGLSEYEFGIEANGVQYYFLLENHSRFTPKGRWTVLGWSEGNVPNDWNDVLAIQHYDSTKHSKLDEQEYEKFFIPYADNIYKLIDENSKVIVDMIKYHGRVYGSEHYNLVAANEISLYQETLKVMKVEAPDKYKASHNMLVKAMYRVSRMASVYIKGHEGYKDELEYNNWRYYNNRDYEPKASEARDLVNKAYACFEAGKLNETFDEHKYDEIEYQNRVEITRLIDKQINKYTNLTLRYADPAVTRVNNTQFIYYANEGNATDYKRFCYIFEKDKNGKWMIVSKIEL